MDELAKEYVISFFDRKLLIHGDRPESTGWSALGALRRFEAILEIGDINGAKILDYGCGKGDFYGFLKQKGINVTYSGFDINEKLISTAQRKFPGVDFRVFDAEENDLQEEFDYIFLCGVFNLKLEGIGETVKNTLSRLFPKCAKALAFNALSSYAPRKDYQLSYLSPEEMFSFAVRSLSPFVSLRHDRLADDLILFVYRELNSFSPPI